MSKNRNRENVYAYKGERAIEADIVHISEVPSSESGRGAGYYCLGCKRQMQAVKPIQVLEYFRHDPKMNKGKQKCTYSDEKYRHKLAKDILQGLKKVKVPRIYKFSPTDKKGKALLIRDSEYIKAHTVLNDHYVFENSLGNIQIEHRVEKPETKGLIVKPDVTFLDGNGKPILLIEIVATHKPEFEKLVKFKRLGIDAIQISIPKDSPENIEQTFHTTKRTKWIYNGEEENADYIQLSESHGDGILEIDDLQRKFFEENFKCRSFQIKELIRGVEIILGTEFYSRLEGDFRSEIRRVEKNSERNRERLEGLRKTHSEAGTSEHKERRELLSKEQRDFRTLIEGLEERYIAKRRELESEERRVNAEISEIEFAFQSLESRGDNISRTIEDERGIIEGIRTDSERTRQQIERLSDEHREIEQRIRERIATDETSIMGEYNRIQQLIHSAPESFERERKKLGENYQILRNGVNKRITEVKRTRNGSPRKFETDRTELEKRFAGIRERILEDIQNESYEGSGTFTKEFSELGKLSRSIMVYTKTSTFYEGLRNLDK